VRSPRAEPVDEPAEPLPAGLDAVAAPDRAAALWNNGPRWWLVEAASPQQVRGFNPDFAAIAAWTNATRATGVAIFAFETADGHDLVVRAFCPGDAVNVPEDPVTGSANALVAALLHRQGRLPGHDGRYVASQGRELGRDGRVQVRVDEDGDVWIGGEVRQVIEGHLDW
jgi:PhzF family phenazine biosynthesis protein